MKKLELSILELDIFEKFSMNLKKKSTRTDYLILIKAFKYFLQTHDERTDKTGDFKLIDVSKNEASKYINDYLVNKKVYSEATREKHYLYLHSFYNYLLDYRLISENPFKDQDRPKIKRVKNKVMSFTELTKFLECAKESEIKQKVAALFIAMTGCSLIELTELKWSDIQDTEKGIFCKLERNMTRFIKIIDELYDVIEEYRKAMGFSKDIYNTDSPFFTNKKFKKYTYNYVSTMINKIFKEAFKEEYKRDGKLPYTAKDLRGSFNTYCFYYYTQTKDFTIQDIKNNIGLKGYEDMYIVAADSLDARIKKETAKIQKECISMPEYLKSKNVFGA